MVDTFPRVAAIIPAAGTGTRLQAQLNQPKQFARLAGKPLLTHTLLVFEQCEVIEDIVIPAREEDISTIWDETVTPYSITKVREVLPGGRTRQESVWNGMQALQTTPPEIVVIHDAARIFIRPDIIREAVVTAEQYGGSVVGIPAVDTIKMSHGTVIESTVDRTVLWSAQTPQTFRYDLLCRAFQNAVATGYTGTDEAMLVEQLGEQVVLIRGNKQNFKVTDPDDLEIAQALLAYRMEGESS